MQGWGQGLGLENSGTLHTAHSRVRPEWGAQPEGRVGHAWSLASGKESTPREPRSVLLLCRHCCSMGPRNLLQVTRPSRPVLTGPLGATGKTLASDCYSSGLGIGSLSTTENHVMCPSPTPGPLHLLHPQRKSALSAGSWSVTPHFLRVFFRCMLPHHSLAAQTLPSPRTPVTLEPHAPSPTAPHPQSDSSWEARHPVVD